MTKFSTFLYFVITYFSGIFAQRGQLISNLQCSFLLNYDTRGDASTVCIFSNVYGNTSVIFNILSSYDGLPIDFESFEVLEFIESEISRIPPKLLDNFKNTEILIVRNVSLGSICDIESATNLREIYASQNKIKNIGENAFYFNKELAHLDLSFNQIHTLKPYTFMYTKKLKFLNLSHNKLKMIPNAFYHLHKLEFLDVSYNWLMSLYSTDFYGMNEVTTLKLEGNSIKEVSPTAFTSMSKLVSVSLRNNSLFEIILNFTNPRQVFAVDLSMNFLWELEVLQSVRKIDASQNKLSSLILGKNLTIQEFNLSRNLFKDTTSVRELKSLKRLYLSGNQLTHVNHRTFYSLTELLELDLSDNLLKHLNLNALAHMDSLNRISIADNDVSFIRLPTNESALPVLETIDVTRNSFSCKYLVTLIKQLNDRNWRLVSREVDHAANFLNIPCFNENELQACRREMDELYVNMSEQNNILQEKIGALYARLENDSKNNIKRIPGSPFLLKGRNHSA